MKMKKIVYIFFNIFFFFFKNIHMEKKKIKVKTCLKKNLKFKKKNKIKCTEKISFKIYFLLITEKYFLIIPNSNNNGHLFFRERFVFFQTLSITPKTPFGVFWNTRSLPSIWSLKDRWSWLERKKRFDWGDIEISPCNLKITYRGLGRSDEDAASIRADKTIPDFLPFFYYEVRVLNIGEFGYIGIGLCSPYVDLDRLPGWEKDSLGYHGDDGHAFRDSGTGIPYGPSFATGDVIGVCFSPINKKIFFTKNGKALPPIFCDFFENERSPTSPMVGLRTTGETIEINFGKKPFEFDLNLYSQSLMYISIEKTLILGNFSEQKFIKKKPVKLSSFFSNDSLAEFPDFGNRNLIIKEMVRKKIDLSKLGLSNTFYWEDNILCFNNFFKKFFENVIETSFFYTEIIYIFHKINNEENWSGNLSNKNFGNFPTIHLTKLFRKVLKGFFKFKMVQKKIKFEEKFFFLELVGHGEEKIPILTSIIKSFSKKKKTKKYRLKYSEDFIIYQPILSFKSLFLVDFLEVAICSLKKKNSKNFSIFFSQPLKFIVTFSSLLEWLI